MANQSTWEARDIVDEYARASELQLPEKALLEFLKDRLPQMRMLDLGVGGRCTTLHFALRVREYVGLDYSAEMIGACQKRFSVNDANATPLSFVIGNARAMAQFPTIIRGV
jgi:ubiquinone/menaquinone biosynthesis C-methylase UbiE